MPTTSVQELSIFARYARLRDGLPHVPLGAWPTPVTACPDLAADLGMAGLYVKRDDLSGSLYGGNKVRKLEFLLAEARRRGKREVLTFGYAGSNHCLATAIYAESIGLRGISMLLPQTNARSVRRNLLLGHRHGAELHHYQGMKTITAGTLLQLALHALHTGKTPMMIPAGGSSPLGAVGFVNAAFELADQVQQGALPEPDILYIAVGSMGSCVGLTIGVKAAGLGTSVVPVRVIEEGMANRTGAARLYTQTLTLLRRHDSSFPEVALSDTDLDIRGDYFGPGYGQYTREGVEALRLLRDAADVTLDGTYSAKALAAVIGDARAGQLDGKNVVFWDTYNSVDVWSEVENADYHDLPRPFHRYFEEDTQPLDNG